MSILNLKYQILVLKHWPCKLFFSFVLRNQNTPTSEIRYILLIYVLVLDQPSFFGINNQNHLSKIESPWQQLLDFTVRQRLGKNTLCSLKIDTCPLQIGFIPIIHHRHPAVVMTDYLSIAQHEFSLSFNQQTNDFKGIVQYID